jgi:transcriptional regulator with GAF, ATPase, and Fis domain
VTETSEHEKPVSGKLSELLLELRDRHVYVWGTLGASLVSALTFLPWAPFVVDDTGQIQAHAVVGRVVCLVLIPLFAAADKAADAHAKKKSKADLDEDARKAQETYRKSISSLLVLARWGADIANETPVKRKAQLRELRSVLATATHGLSSVPQTRATYYTLEFTEQGRILKEPVSWGRVEEATTIWVESENPNHSVWRIMDNEDVNAPIVRATDPEMRGWADWSTKKYQSFISVPVKARGVQFGMLSLNAPNSEDLTETDRMAVLVAARLMATTLSLAYEPTQLKEQAQQLTNLLDGKGTQTESPNRDEEAGEGATDTEKVSL